MSTLSNNAVLGLAAFLSAAELAAAQIDLHEASVSATGQTIRAEFMKKSSPPRDLVVIGKSTDLPTLVKSDPLVVILSLPQHGETNLAREAAFEYTLSHVTPAGRTDSGSNLVERTSTFTLVPHKEAVASGVRKVAEHLKLIDSYTGLDRNQTNRVALYTDEALRHLVEVHEILPKVGGSGDSQSRLRDAIHVTRNLSFEALPVDEGTVSRARLELLVYRDRFYGIKPFEGRSVVFAAHSEKLTDYSTQLGRTTWTKEEAQRFIKNTGDNHRFGKEGTQQRIKAEAVIRGGSFVLLRAESSAELEAVKARTLKAIENTPPGPMGFTFVFDGHGGPDAVYLSSSDLRTSQAEATNAGRSVKITSEELATAFRNRAKSSPGSACVADDKRDIVMIIGCFSQNLIRDLGKRLGDLPAAPFLVGAAEFGQYGYSLPSSPFGSRAFHPAFSRPYAQPTSTQLKPATTFGDLINLGVFPDVRPTFFIPAEQDCGPVKAGTVPKHNFRYRQIGMLRSPEQSEG